MAEIEVEIQAKKRVCDYTVWRAFRNKHVLLLIVPYFLALMGAQANVFWIPTFIHRWSGLSGSGIALWVALPGLAGIVGMLLNGWDSDKTGERRWHTAMPLILAGLAYLIVPWSRGFPPAMALLIFGGGCMFAYYPVFWSIPSSFLTASGGGSLLWPDQLPGPH